METPEVRTPHTLAPTLCGDNHHKADLVAPSHHMRTQSRAAFRSTGREPGNGRGFSSSLLQCVSPWCRRKGAEQKATGSAGPELARTQASSDLSSLSGRAGRAGMRAFCTCLQGPWEPPVASLFKVGCPEWPS